MPENQVSKDADKPFFCPECEAKKTIIMVSFTVEITAPFYDFLKEYLAFFGSHMTIEDLAQQMIYQESNRLHNDLTEYVKDVDNNHYVGKIPWFLKFREVAITTGNWASFEDLTPEDEENKEDPAAKTTEETAAGGEKHE